MRQNCMNETMPPPPDVIYLHGYRDDEQADYYDSPAPPKEWSRGPDSCERYWDACTCDKCEVREAWVNANSHVS